MSKKLIKKETLTKDLTNNNQDKDTYKPIGHEAAPVKTFENKKPFDHEKNLENLYKNMEENKSKNNIEEMDSIVEEIKDALKDAENYKKNFRAYVKEAHPNFEYEEESDDEKLSPMDMSDFLKKDFTMKYIVDNMFAEASLNMIYAKPKNMKSFISYYLSLCMINGKDFFGIHVEQVNVGYFDWENSGAVIKQRIGAISKSNDLPIIEDRFFIFHYDKFFITSEKEGIVINIRRVEELKNYIKEKNIKVLFFDVYRRMGQINENSNDDASEIKSKLFNELLSIGCCIIFLHHTVKDGSTSRGASDLTGMVDTAYSIEKKNIDVLDDKDEDSVLDNESMDYVYNMQIKNEECRNGERSKILGRLNISSHKEDNGTIKIIDESKFTRIYELDETTSKKRIDAFYDRFLDRLQVNRKYINKELLDILKEMNPKSTSTHKRFIKKLKDEGVLIKKANTYYISDEYIRSKKEKEDIVFSDMESESE